MKDLTKQDSLVLKGIAMLMVLCHHNFRTTDLFKNYTISFWPFHQYQVVHIASFFKISLPFFIFVTGYGLTYSLRSINKEYRLTKKEMSKWLIVRLIKVLSSYWIVFLAISVICQIIDGRTGNIYFSHGFLYGIYQYVIGFFGLSRLLGTPMLVYTWWYMSSAVIYVFLVPIFNRIAKNYTGYGAGLVLCWLLPHLMGLPYMGDTHPFSFVLVLFLGCTCAEYGIFGWMKNIKSERYPHVSEGIKFLLGIFILYVCYKEFFVFFRKDIWEIAINIIPFYLIYWCYAYVCPIPYLNRFFAFIGKHSMNIFLTHTFIRGVYCADFIYSWGHFMLINLVLLLISIGISYIIEGLKYVIHYEKHINNLIEGCVAAVDRGKEYEQN